MALLFEHVPSEEVRGVELDEQTRCVHYGTDEDVVAIRFGCCEEYYGCFKCHEAVAEHPAEPWPTERRAEPAVRCGVCESEMTAVEYLATEACPNCEVRFNPGCAEHYHVYFEWIGTDDRDRRT